MIPKSSRFKCERCGYLKKRPGKCVVCRKVADFDNLMGGGVESRHASVSLVSGPAGNARRGTRPDSRISDRPAHHSNFPVPVLAELNVSVQLHDASGEAREAQSWQAAQAEVTSKSRGGEYFMSAWRNEQKRSRLISDLSDAGLNPAALPNLCPSQTLKSFAAT